MSSWGLLCHHMALRYGLLMARSWCSFAFLARHGVPGLQALDTAWETAQIVFNMCSRRGEVCQPGLVGLDLGALGFSLVGLDLGALGFGLVGCLALGTLGFGTALAALGWVGVGLDWTVGGGVQACRR